MLNKALAKESNGDELVYYIDKNKAMQLSSAIGVQFPGGFKNIDGYVHSIRDSGSPVNMKIENVTKINRHNAREQSKKGSIYFGLLRDGENLYIGRAITNDSNVLEDVEALYALSNKKESVAHNRLDSGDNLRLDTDSKISIADFLNIVKDKYADVLPKNVLDSLNVERPNSSVSDTVRYSKELMTAEEKKKVREAERAAYLERQLVSTAPLGGKAKAVSPTAKAAVAKKIASGMPGVSTAQVNEQLTKFDAYNHIKSLTAI